MLLMISVVFGNISIVSIKNFDSVINIYRIRRISMNIITSGNFMANNISDMNIISLNNIDILIFYYIYYLLIFVYRKYDFERFSFFSFPNLDYLNIIRNNLKYLKRDHDIQLSRYLYENIF